MTHTLAYVSCAESREILVFSLDTRSGAVTLEQRLPTAGAPSPLRLGASRRVLYAGTRAENAVVALAIDAGTGKLELFASTPSADSPTYVSTDRAMRALFCASYSANTLSVFPLAAGGAPLPASQIEVNLPHAHAALVDLSDRWLLVPVLGADAIFVYRLDENTATLALTANTPPVVAVRPGAGPRHLVFSPDNEHVYCLNELDASIDRFAFDTAAGHLTLKQSVSILPPGFSGKPWAAELRLTPDGRFLYASERTASVIAAFSVAEDSGELTLVDHYPTEQQPRAMAIDPSGRWLVAAGQLSAQLTVYTLDPASGRLHAVQRHATGLDPICVEMIDLAGDGDDG